MLFVEKQGLNEAEMAEVRKRLEMTEEEEVEYMKTRHAKSNPITDEEIEAALKSEVADFYRKYNPAKEPTKARLAIEKILRGGEASETNEQASYSTVCHPSTQIVKVAPKWVT